VRIESNFRGLSSRCFRGTEVAAGRAAWTSYWISRPGEAEQVKAGGGTLEKVVQQTVVSRMSLLEAARSRAALTAVPKVPEGTQVRGRMCEISIDSLKVRSAFPKLTC
jgi:hypothetical protein